MVRGIGSVITFEKTGKYRRVKINFGKVMGKTAGDCSRQALNNKSNVFKKFQ